jgi:hypothetical protein
MRKTCCTLDRWTLQLGGLTHGCFRQVSANYKPLVWVGLGRVVRKVRQHPDDHEFPVTAAWYCQKDTLILISPALYVFTMWSLAAAPWLCNECVGACCACARSVGHVVTCLLVQPVAMTDCRRLFWNHTHAHTWCQLLIIISARLHQYHLFVLALVILEVALPG